MSSAYGSQRSTPAGDSGIDDTLPDLGDPSHEHDFHDSHEHTPDHKTRLRKACDSCSVRKIKCDESGPPCAPCASLGLPCTWDRPTRRRGPPNRHAEAIKRQRLEQSYRSEPASPSSPTSAAHTLTSIARSPILAAESIGPMLLLNPLIDDYFTYIHPLVLLPHEPTFRASLQQREDRHNPAFLGLLAAMIGALVVSFPRKPRRHLKALGQESLYPRSMNLVDRCHRITVEARGTGFLDKRHDITDAATSYLLALSTAYSLRWRQSKLYFAECLSILRSLGLHKRFDSTAVQDSRRDGGEDYITRETGRRLFWVLCVGVRSFRQLGLASADLYMPPATPLEPHPPWALEVDDSYISTDAIGPQPPDVISEVVGFNANVRVYQSYVNLENLEITMGLGRVDSWEFQCQELRTALDTCKAALDDLPAELRLLQPGGASASFGIAPEPSPDPVADAADRDSRHRRRLQYEIQKANIYISQLGTRSHIVDRFWSLYDAQPVPPPGPEDAAISGVGAVAAAMAEERELVVHDLLVVLRSVSQVNMEPNGASLIYKIRQIASTLLDAPRSRQGSLARRAHDYLIEIVEMLMKLERVPRRRDGSEEVRSPDTAVSWGEEDDEAELQHWTEFRDAQQRFVESGGVLDL